jgi:hypothetical protein
MYNMAQYSVTSIEILTGDNHDQLTQNGMQRLKIIP